MHPFLELLWVLKESGYRVEEPESETEPVRIFDANGARLAELVRPSNGRFKSES